MNIVKQIRQKAIPRHVALIMDGNGRWAKQRGLPRVEGHKEGVKRVQNIIAAGLQIGVPYLTFFAFSTENWQRPQEEVHALMQLLAESIEQYLPRAHEEKIRLWVIGDRTRLPERTRARLEEALHQTEQYDRLNVVLALNYSGRWEITETARRLAQAVQEGQLQPDQIDERRFTEYMPTYPIPEPDLMIRTSGELRISNFYLWQLAYTELYFTPTLWPDFTEREFFEAILDWQRRERRFGKISEQIQPR